MKQSTIRREWIPCKICKYLDKEQFRNKCELCENDTIGDHSGFYPSNDFQQFLRKNDFKIGYADSRFNLTETPCIIFIDDKKTFDNIQNLFPSHYQIEDKYLLDYWNNDVVNYLEFNYKYGIIYLLPIDKSVRDDIYNSEFIMHHYKVYMCYDKPFTRKNIIYKLDRRFYHIEY